MISIEIEKGKRMKRIDAIAAAAAVLLLASSPAYAMTAAEEAAQDAPAVSAKVSVASQGTQSATPEQYIDKDKTYRVVNGGDWKIASLRADGLMDHEYRLRKYDSIKLMAVGFPDAFGVDAINVGPDGYAQVPYVGNVKLAGLTVNEATELLRDGLNDYLKITQLSLYISEYAPMKVYVMGEVTKPGIQIMTIDDMNTYAAISSAGGFTKRSRTRKVQVIRTIGNTMYYRTLDIGHYIKRHDLTQNVQLEEGDIVYVPRSNKLIVNEDVMPYINAYLLWRNITDD